MERFSINVARCGPDLLTDQSDRRDGLGCSQAQHGSKPLGYHLRASCRFETGSPHSRLKPMIRSGPPLPPPIFIGRAITHVLSVN